MRYITRTEIAYIRARLELLVNSIVMYYSAHKISYIALYKYYLQGINEVSTSICIGCISPNYYMGINVHKKFKFILKFTYKDCIEL